MHLAFVLFEYFPYGGLQRDMLAIAEQVMARGHAVTVWTRAWHGTSPPVGLHLEILPTAGGSNHARDAALARAAAARWHQADLRVGFNKMPGLDWYYAADGCLAARHGGLKRWLPRYRSRLAMEEAVFGPASSTRILSISPPQLDLYRRHYGTAAERFVSLPPGIRRDRCMPPDYAARRAALRERLQRSDRERVLLFVGSGFRTKGLERAIRLLADRGRAEEHLYVVGDDRQGPYQRQARALGVMPRVHFMGGQDNVPEWLWAADLLVHPAHAENTGTVLLEAAVAGLPVLTTAACGYSPYIRDHDLGEVVGSGDEPTVRGALAAAAERLLSRPREQAWAASRAFARDADIYSLTAHAADALLSAAP